MAQIASRSSVAGKIDGVALDEQKQAQVDSAVAKGAKVLLDCYQSVGSLDIDVKALDVDFAVGGMLKYLLESLI